MWSTSLEIFWNSSMQTTIFIPFFLAITSGRFIISSFLCWASFQEKLTEKSLTGSAPKEKEGVNLWKKFLPACNNSSFLLIEHLIISFEYFSRKSCSVLILKKSINEDLISTIREVIWINEVNNHMTRAPGYSRGWLLPWWFQRACIMAPEVHWPFYLKPLAVSIPHGD